MNNDDVIICRCEDLTQREIQEAIRDGYTDMEELKRYLRCGMGPCGGRTCLPLIRRELARHLGISIDEVPMPTSRPPQQVTTFSAILSGAEKNNE